jgi:transcription termination factor Rho
LNGKTPATVTALFERVGKSGYLRFPAAEYRERPTDPMVPGQLCRDLKLRGGERVEGVIQETTPRQGGTHELQEITAIDGVKLAQRREISRGLVPFEDLKLMPVAQKLKLSTSGGPLAMRIIDLFAPIGFGQRGIIVAPPRTGKTILLQQIAHAIAANHPRAHVLVVVIDERPEEVTEMKRSLPGEVVASGNDAESSNHVRIAELMLERAKRMVEGGKDVVVILDSLTRLSRAYNAEARARGRVLTQELERQALARPRAILESARAVSPGGSLTVIASLLAETGNALDGAIVEEFKGTAEMELVLSSELASHRVWPAIDVPRSGTHTPEVLLSDAERAAAAARLKKLGRKGLSAGVPKLYTEMRKFDTNEELVEALA